MISQTFDHKSFLQSTLTFICRSICLRHYITYSVFFVLFMLGNQSLFILSLVKRQYLVFENLNHRLQLICNTALMLNDCLLLLMTKLELLAHNSPSSSEWHQHGGLGWHLHHLKQETFISFRKCRGSIMIGLCVVWTQAVGWTTMDGIQCRWSKTTNQYNGCKH